MSCLAERCAFGDLSGELIRDRIVLGLRDTKLSESSQLDPVLALVKATARLHHSEEIKKLQPILRGSTNERQSGNLDAISTRRQIQRGTKG